MFTHACQIAWDTQCSVGWGDASVECLIHGSGVWLSPTVAITALHCVDEEAVNGGYPVLLGHDGPYRSRIIASFPDADIAMLRTEQRIAGSANARPVPTEFLRIAHRPLWLGTSVGFLTRLVLQDAGRSLFCQTAIGALADGDHAHFALSATVLQAGHSGSPVFDQAGILVGIIVQSWQFRTSTKQQDMTHTLPVMSSTIPLVKAIQAALVEP